MTSRFSAKDVTSSDKKHYPEFLYDSCPADVQLKSRLRKSRLDRHHAVDGISNASTSVGSSSVETMSNGSPEDAALKYLPSRHLLATFLMRQQPLEPTELQTSPKGKGTKQNKKVGQHVRFRPPLRMNR